MEDADGYGLYEELDGYGPVEDMEGMGNVEDSEMPGAGTADTAAAMAAMRNEFFMVLA